MNLDPVDLKRAWEIAHSQLEKDLSRSVFQERVSSCEIASIDMGKVILSVPTEANRIWLKERMTRIMEHLLSGILNQEVSVEFVTWSTSSQRGDEIEETNLVVLDNKKIQTTSHLLEIEPTYLAEYDRLVKPEQVIVIPGYFTRYLPLLGTELSWLYIGFRQCAYESGASNQKGRKLRIPSRKVAKYSGMSLRTFWRRAANPETWSKLKWLVNPVETDVRWKRGADGHPHQEANVYQVNMTIPLTPFDEISLRTWFHKQLGTGKSAISVLQLALETSVDELIPGNDYNEQAFNMDTEPHSIQDIVFSVLGGCHENQKMQIAEMSDRLAQHLMPSRDLIFITHYFMINWLPMLGPGPGWLVTLMRDRCFINRRTGELREEATISKGYSEICQWLGLKRTKTIWEWLKSSTISNFIRERSGEAGSWEASPRRFWVRLDEPLTEKHIQCLSDDLQDRDYSCSSPIWFNNAKQESLEISIDAYRHNPRYSSNNKICEENFKEKAESIDTPTTHYSANDIHSGGYDMHTPGADDSHTVGANDIHNGADDIDGWRDWHSFNTLTPQIKHSENTAITTCEMQGSSGAVSKVVEGWNLAELLACSRVNLKMQKALQKCNADAGAFVSWLLYAASPAGQGIHDPVGHAASRLLADPKHGAGGAFDRLAGLNPEDLLDLLNQALEMRMPWNTDWRGAFRTASLANLRRLADQLGLDNS